MSYRVKYIKKEFKVKNIPFLVFNITDCGIFSNDPSKIAEKDIHKIIDLVSQKHPEYNNWIFAYDGLQLHGEQNLLDLLPKQLDYGNPDNWIQENL